MTDWLTDLQTIRPLRDTNRPLQRPEMQEAARSPPMLVAYSNPQKVRFAVFSHSPDQLKYQDAKTAWNRIIQPASHAAPEEETEERETRTSGQLTGKNREEPQEANLSGGQ